MKTEDLVQTAQAIQQLKKSQAELGPQTDDELHEWIKFNLGYDIPRISVCDDHQAPFQFIADLYFERIPSAVALANRGGSKTLSSAIIHFLNSLFKPTCESMTVGAIEAQAKRCYENLKKIIVKHGGDNVYEPKDHPEIIRTIESETSMRNGSKVEIVPGTMAAVSGPHPQKVHFDEQDQAPSDVWEQSRHMALSKTIINKDGTEKLIRAQNWVTSTRQRPHGPMQRLIDEIEVAESNGYKAPFKLYTWCVWETSKNVPNCRMANPDLPEDQKCDCNMVVKDEWDDGEPRRFSDVCNGKLARAHGFFELDDVHDKFLQASRDEWEAQQECSKPEIGGSVFKKFTRDRHGIKWWEPDPVFGAIYCGIDAPGGSTPAAINWYQVLKYDLEWWGKDQLKNEAPKKTIKAGTRIVFDEAYKANVGNNETIRMIKDREEYWKSRYPDFKVEKRFCDPAGKTLRHDLAEAGMPTKWFTHREIKEQIKTCNGLFDSNLIMVDLTRCPWWVKECEAYHYPKKKDDIEYDPEIPVDDFNHTMSNFRYVMENLKWLDRKRGMGAGGAPKASGNIYETAKSPVKSSAPRYMNTERVKFKTRWPV